jgi:L-2-hydroxycarboxylate dehydrogenase (NAD+)
MAEPIPLILKGAGARSRDASVVADSSAHANLRGVDSRGVARLPNYVKGLSAGTINARPRIAITQRQKR